MMQRIFDWFSDIAEEWDLNGVKFAIYTTIAVLIGGLFELILLSFSANCYSYHSG